MNKLCKLVLAWLLPLAALAQQEVATVPLSKFPIPIRSLNEITPAVDEAGNTCLYLHYNGLANKSLQFLTLSPQGQVVHMSQLQHQNLSKTELLGALSKRDAFVFFRYNKLGAAHNVLPILVDKTTGEPLSLPALTPTLPAKSELVTSFTDQNQVYMLFYAKKEKTLEVLRLNAEGAFSQQTIPVNIHDAPSHFLRYGDVIYMQPDGAKTVFATHHQKKAYLQGDKLYLLFDSLVPPQSKSATTEILTLDLSRSTAQLTKLPEVPIGVSSDFNSFLHQDKVLRLQLSRSELILSMFDVNTLQLLAQHTFTKDDDLTLKSGPVVKRGANSIYESDYKVLEKTSQVLRKMDKGQPAIVAENIGGNIVQLTIGAYQQPSSNAGAPIAMSVGGGTISTPNGPVSLPSSMVYSHSYMNNFGMYSHGTGVSTYFKALLHADTFEKVEHPETQTLQDMLDAYEESLRVRSVGAKVVYRNKGNAYMVYEDKDNKALKLVQFNAPQQL